MKLSQMMACCCRPLRRRSLLRSQARPVVTAVCSELGRVRLQPSVGQVQHWLRAQLCPLLWIDAGLKQQQSCVILCSLPGVLRVILVDVRVILPCWKHSLSCMLLPPRGPVEASVEEQEQAEGTDSLWHQPPKGPDVASDVADLAETLIDGV